MTQHIVKSFQEELDGLSAQIAQMGGLTEAQLSASIEAVVRRDTQLAERTIREDQRIDVLESEIENHAIRLIALRQPMAGDLREAIAAIKI
ncbi:MAG: PhoU domain-containing protein, partial [Parvibaculum sp.]|nr:PhoU domain-containing protein [Parvibaculum sp.]